MAAKRCQGRVILTLEGGYDVEALATLTAAHLEGLIRGLEGPRSDGE